MARGRKPINVTSDELQVAIGLAETSQQFTARNQLWKYIEESEWAKTRTPRPLLGQTAMLLAQKYNLRITTPVGKRGAEKGVRIVGTRKSRRMPEDRRISLLTVTPPQFHKSVERAATGNLRSAVKLKCLECSGNVKKEVSQCTVMNCALWSFRPYKSLKTKESVDA